MKRFDCETRYNVAVMEESDSGEWVRYDDAIAAMWVAASADPMTSLILLVESETDEARCKLFKRMLDAYCMDCGSDAGRRCHCMNDD